MASLITCPCEGKGCKLLIDHDKHGSVEGYDEGFCRCSKCRSAKLKRGLTKKKACKEPGCFRRRWRLELCWPHHKKLIEDSC